MSEATTNKTDAREDAQREDDAQQDSRDDAGADAVRAPVDERRSLLLVADEGVQADAIREKLSSVGFEVACVSAEEAAHRIEEATRRAEEVAPSIILLAFGGREGEGRLLALARRLRIEPESFALPLIFLFREGGRTLRSAAQHLGADDYFAQDASADELRARLEALLWRVESGRRSSPVVAEQRSEIDNFLFLLDAVGADARDGATGAVALVEAGRGRDDVSVKDEVNASISILRPSALNGAHGFLKLNLRRVDAVAFYGPATLLVYLHGADSHSARATLSRLREEFSEATPGGDLFIGISCFPAHGSEVERLVEQAEVALGEARAENSATRVVVYGVGDARHNAPDAERRTAASVGRRKMTGVLNETMSDASNKRASSLTNMALTNAALTSEAAMRVGAGTQVGERRSSARVRRVMLVISDAARMAQVNLLMRSAAYEVRAAFDGQHALNLLRIDRPDALVVDYALNEMDGVEMLKRLAKQSRPGQSPPALIFLPAGREDLRDEALRAGARGIVDMPYDAVELLDMLRDFCETE
jgi:DNA-binding response OmpR family regulator